MSRRGRGDIGGRVIGLLLPCGTAGGLPAGAHSLVPGPGDMLARPQCFRDLPRLRLGARTQTALGASHRRLARVGKATAVTATARKIAVLFYESLWYGMLDLGKTAVRQTTGTRMKATAGSTSQLTVVHPELCKSDPAKNDAQATVPKTRK